MIRWGSFTLAAACLIALTLTDVSPTSVLLAVGFAASFTLFTHTLRKTNR